MSLRPTSSLPQRVTTSDFNINALDHVKILKQSAFIENTAHIDSETELTCSESMEAVNADKTEPQKTVSSSPLFAG